MAMANTSFIWQQAEHTTYNYHLQAVEQAPSIKA